MYHVQTKCDNWVSKHNWFVLEKMQIKIKEHALSLVSENYYCVLFLLGLLNKEGVVSHYRFEPSASRF